MKTKVKTLAVSEFKTKCLRILDELGPQGIIVTKRGKPVAKITPMWNPDIAKFYGCMKGKLKGDIFSTGRKWNAQSGKKSSQLSAISAHRLAEC